MSANRNLGAVSKIVADARERVPPISFSDSREGRASARPRSWRATLMLTAILATSSLLTGCDKKDNAGPATPQGPQAVPVDAVPVAVQRVTDAIAAVGDIKADEQVTLYSKVAGKLLGYKASEGEQVKREQVIALIDRDEVGFKFQEAPVLSTIDGTVGITYLDRGADIRLDTPVALIVKIDSVRLKVSIPERQVPKIKVGQTAGITVDAYPDRTFEGRVDKISPVVDLKTRTAPAEVLIPNSDRLLLPGMFARVQIVMTTRSNALIIPEEAVVFSGGDAYVFVVDGGAVNRRAIKLGARQPGRVEVTEGLSANEIVVTAGQQKIKDGSPVAIKESASNE